MWTPPGRQAGLQTESMVAWSGYCRMSGLLMQPSLAAGPYGVREDRIPIDESGSKALELLEELVGVAVRPAAVLAPAVWTAFTGIFEV